MKINQTMSIIYEEKGSALNGETPDFRKLLSGKKQRSSRRDNKDGRV